ncbi:MAG: phosphoenolpyruvate carboxykinase (ATP) [Patescibacteria group bacterium]
MPKTLHENLSVEELVKKALENKEGKLSKTKALVVETGKYTGRSPEDKFIVDTPSVHDKIDWGKVNVPISKEKYDKLFRKVQDHLENMDEAYYYQGVLGADPEYEMPVEVTCEYAYEALFCRYMLCKEFNKDTQYILPQLKIYCLPSCHADPEADGVNSEAFIILNLEEMTVLIGGSKYAGEMKKSMFSVMNYLLPEYNVFPMHCSANMGEDGDTALFFGLSGTGKTTLSADPNRKLIGDDEHGWSENGIFNFEGGCYAKCIDLKEENEPDIYNAIRDHALLENVVLTEEGDMKFEDSSLTENTRAAYPLCYIRNIVPESMGGHPGHVVFLAADAFGILPPVAKLDTNAALYYFLSGYTAKLAGTERGVTEPVATFSTCFGAPFMPLSPVRYGELLGEYTQKYKSQVYLVNTGWTGGAYGTGERISIKLTRQIITDILSGKMDKAEFVKNERLNLMVPKDMQDPRETWADKDAYDKQSQELIKLFKDNFNQFPNAPKEVVEAGPQ